MESPLKRNSLTMEKKLQVLEALKLKTQTAVAKEFNVDQSTISRIKKGEDKIRNVLLTNGNLSKKRKRESPNEEIGKALIEWFHQMQYENTTVNGPLMMEKANQIAKTLGHVSFVPTKSWLERLKIRHNIKFRLGGDKTSTDETQPGVENWITNLVNEYEESDIFNANETGLYCKAMPSGTLAVTGVQSTSEKMPKDRVTVLLLSNSNGTESQLYIVGKSTKPQFFRQAQPPLPYFTSDNACMTSKIWTDIIAGFDRELGSRKIVLFVDDVACHQVDGELKNIKLVLLKSSTVSVIQPLNQGIIRCLKIHYRTQVLRGMLQAMSAGMTILDYAKSIDVLKTLHMLKRAWKMVTSSIIQSCFRKAGFQKDGIAMVEMENDENEVLCDELAAEFGATRDDFVSFVDFDKDVATRGSLTDDEIWEQMQCRHRNGSNDTGDAEDGPSLDVNKVTNREVLHAMSTIRHYLEQNATEYDAYYELENIIEKIVSEKCTQQKISYFFF